MSVGLATRGVIMPARASIKYRMRAFATFLGGYVFGTASDVDSDGNAHPDQYAGGIAANHRTGEFARRTRNYIRGDCRSTEWNDWHCDRRASGCWWAYLVSGQLYRLWQWLDGGRFLRSECGADSDEHAVDLALAHCTRLAVLELHAGDGFRIARADDLLDDVARLMLDRYHCGAPAQGEKHALDSVAIVGIALSAKPGKGTIVVARPGSPEERRTFEIAPVRYAEQRLKVAPAQVDLSAGDLARYERERAHLAQVIPGLGLYAVGLLVVLLAVTSSIFEPRAIWSRVVWADGTLPPDLRPRGEGAGDREPAAAWVSTRPELASCGTCGLLSRPAGPLAAVAWSRKVRSHGRASARAPRANW